MFYSKTSNNCLFCDTLCSTSSGPSGVGEGIEKGSVGKVEVKVDMEITVSCKNSDNDTKKDSTLQDQNCNCHKDPCFTFGNWGVRWEDYDNGRFHQRLEYLFVLRMLLDYPLQRCTKYMKELNGSENYDEQDGWFSICEACEKLVEEGHSIFHKMEELEERLSELKADLKQSIVSSKRTGSNDNIPTDGKHAEIIQFFRNKNQWMSPKTETVVKVEVHSGYDSDDYEPNEDDPMTEISYDNDNSGVNNDDVEDNYGKDDDEDDEHVANLSSDDSDYLPSSDSEMDEQDVDPPVEVKLNDSTQSCSKSDTPLNVKSDHISDIDRSDDDDQNQKSNDDQSYDSANSEQTEQKAKRLKLVCEICDTEYKTLHRLKEHVQLHSSSDAKSCKKCKFVCQTSRALLIHTNKTHSNASKTSERDSEEKIESEHSGPSRQSKRARNEKRFFKSGKTRGKRSESDESSLSEEDEEGGSDNYKCKYCPASYKYRNALTKHEALHGNKKSAKCSKCSFVCQSNKFLVTHTKKYHPSNTKTLSAALECDLCPAKYYTEHRFKEHVQLHHDPTSFKCAQCGWALPTESGLRHHELKAHKINKPGGPSKKRVRINEGPFTCDHCPAVYGTKHRFKDHVRINHKDKLIQCEECEKCFESAQLLRLHGTKNRCPGKPQDEEKSKPYVCQHCCSSFCSKSKLHRHVAEIHVKQKFPCEFCPAVYPMESRLRYHMSREHKKALHVCTVCGYKSHGASHLRLHMQKHTKEKMYMCEICSKTFTSPTYLTGHKQKEHFKELGVQPIKCDQCDMLLPSKAQLKYHMQKKHEQDFKFFCDACGKGFLFESTMKNHMKVHSTERTEVCEICGAAYVHNRVLLDHMKHHHPESYTAATGRTAKVSSKTNTSQGPYICKFCNQEFAMRYHLHLHLKTHTEIYDKYKCMVCGKGYSSQSGLRRHEETAHVENSFLCNGCSRTFPCKDYLRYHVKNHCKKFPNVKFDGFLDEDLETEEKIGFDPFVVNKGGSVHLIIGGQFDNTSEASSTSTTPITP